MAESTVPAAAPTRPPLELLRDPVVRLLLTELDGDTTLSTQALAERARLGLNQRQLRDKIRDAATDGVVAADTPPPGQPRIWRTTATGRDLARLLAIARRVSSRAVGVSPDAPSVLHDRALDQLLGWTADASILKIAGALADRGPVETSLLAARCADIPRRTMYRRLAPLVDAGAVQHSTQHTMPRSTRYELTTRYRALVALPLVAAWWEARHSPGPIAVPDVSCMLRVAVPLVRMPRGEQCTLQWTTSEPDRSFTTVQREGGTQLTTVPTPDSSPTANLAGRQIDWIAALVTGDTDGIELAGDQQLARRALQAMRAAMLQYVG